MPEIKHTPGPWVVDESRYDGSINRLDPFRHIGMVSQFLYDTGSRAENEANARLIAAAPTLLALVERMRSYMDQAGIDSKPESMNPMEKLASDIDLALAELAQPLNPA